MKYSKNPVIQMKTGKVATENIGECLALNYDFDLPTAPGLPVIGITPLGGIYKNHAISVISYGEAIAIADGAITEGDLLFATTDGKVSTVAAAEIAFARALETVADGEKLKVLVFKRGA
jgi:hypothetical protein